MNIKIDFSKILILGVRGIGILSRFLIAFLFTKKISLEFQGEYTLYSTTITIAVLILGLDFYMYSNRFVIKNGDKALFALKNQLIIQIATYILIFILCLFLTKNYISFQLLSLLSITIFFDHLSQDFFRLYVVMQKMVLANIILFVKSSLWAFFLCIYLLTVNNPEITINQVLVYWLISCSLACIIGFRYYPNVLLFFEEKISLDWIKKGIKVGLVLLLSTITTKIIEYSDRYFIEYFLETKDVGIYSFLFQLSNLVNVIIFTIYISFIFPNLMASANKKDKNELKLFSKEIFKKSGIIIIIYAAISLITLPYLIKIVGRPELYNFQIIFYIMLASNLFMNFTFANYYTLVALEKEKIILWFSLIACLINVLFNFIFIPLIGIIAGAISLLLANIFMYVSFNIVKNKLISSW